MNSWYVGVILLVAFVAMKAFIGRKSPEELQTIAQSIADGARLVDVRTPMEFGAGHIDGAVNIPLSGLQGSTSILGEQNSAIVVYCRSGSRSRTATQMLSRMGYENVLDLGAISNGKRLPNLE